MQKYTEVDEPEDDTAPIVEVINPIFSDDTSIVESVESERMSEEELLRGLEKLAASENNSKSR